MTTTLNPRFDGAAVHLELEASVKARLLAAAGVNGSSTCSTEGKIPSKDCEYSTTDHGPCPTFVLSVLAASHKDNRHMHAKPVQPERPWYGSDEVVIASLEGEEFTLRVDVVDTLGEKSPPAPVLAARATVATVMAAPGPIDSDPDSDVKAAAVAAAAAARTLQAHHPSRRFVHSGLVALPRHGRRQVWTITDGTCAAHGCTAVDWHVHARDCASLPARLTTNEIAYQAHRSRTYRETGCDDGVKDYYHLLGVESFEHDEVKLTAALIQKILDYRMLQDDLLPQSSLAGELLEATVVLFDADARAKYDSLLKFTRATSTRFWLFADWVTIFCEGVRLRGWRWGLYAGGSLAGYIACTIAPFFTFGLASLLLGGAASTASVTLGDALKLRTMMHGISVKGVVTHAVFAFGLSVGLGLLANRIITGHCLGNCAHVGETAQDATQAGAAMSADRTSDGLPEALCAAAGEGAQDTAQAMTGAAVDPKAMSLVARKIVESTKTMTQMGLDWAFCKATTAKPGVKPEAVVHPPGATPTCSHVTDEGNADAPLPVPTAAHPISSRKRHVAARRLAAASSVACDDPPADAARSVRPCCATAGATPARARYAFKFHKKAYGAWVRMVIRFKLPGETGNGAPKCKELKTDKYGEFHTLPDGAFDVTVWWEECRLFGYWPLQRWKRAEQEWMTSDHPDVHKPLHYPEPVQRTFFLRGPLYQIGLVRVDDEIGNPRACPTEW